MIAVGHRGAPRVARENTLVSIEAALDLGADWVEVDARVTADGTVVVIHDETFERLWDLDVVVEEAQWAQVGPLLEAGRREGVPTLAEAIDFIRAAGRTLMIDVASVEIAAACCDLLAGDHDGVVMTGDPDGLVLARSRMPELPTAVSWEERQLPSAELLDRARPQWVNQRHDLLDADAIRSIRNAGCGVCCYTVDAEDQMRALRALGVDAVISNDIALLRKTVRPE